MRRFTLSTRLPGEQQRQRSRARSRKASKAAREGGASSVPKLATPKKKMTALLVDAVCAAVDVPMSLQCRGGWGVFSAGAVKDAAGRSRSGRQAMRGASTGRCSRTSSSIGDHGGRHGSTSQAVAPRHRSRPRSPKGSKLEFWGPCVSCMRIDMRFASKI